MSTPTLFPYSFLPALLQTLSTFPSYTLVLYKDGLQLGVKEEDEEAGTRFSSYEDALDKINEVRRQHFAKDDEVMEYEMHVSEGEYAVLIHKLANRRREEDGLYDIFTSIAAVSSVVALLYCWWSRD